MRIAVLALLLFSSVLSRSALAAPTRSGLLTPADRHVASAAARLAGRSSVSALHWLRGQRTVRTAAISPDGQTIAITFRDGRTTAILPRMLRTTRIPALPLRTFRPDQQTTGSKSAIVLEPFEDELGLGSQAGATVVSALQGAGFTVDEKVNGDVTVAVMENLAQYGFVYMETHSGVLPGGGAIILTAETSAAPYAALIQDGSVSQGLAAGDPNHLYVAITPTFFAEHVGTFPNNAIIYLNGCSVLGSTGLWSALQAKNVGALLSWDHEAYSYTNELAATIVMSDMAGGATVNDALAALAGTPYGTALVGGVTAHMGYAGDGTDTLARILSGAPAPTMTATPSPTATPRLTPTPKPTSKPAKHKKTTKKKAKKKAPKAKKSKPTKCKSGYHRSHGKCVKTKKKH